MVTIKQKPTVDTQKIKKGESKHTIMKNHFRKEGSKRGRKEQGKGTMKQPVNNKMALVSPYLSKIILNVNVLNFPTKDTKWLNSY